MLDNSLSQQYQQPICPPKLQKLIIFANSKSIDDLKMLPSALWIICSFSCWCLLGRRTEDYGVVTG